MNRAAWIATAAFLAAAGMAAGYWIGTRNAEQPSRAAAQGNVAGAEGAAKKERKLLYYRNPMGLPDTSPTPKKDPMGMDYIPVYEGEGPAPTGTGLKISVDKVQKLGVRTEPAGFRSLTRTVRAVGTLQIDERRINTVAPKFEGWIEQLHVSTTGQPVTRGQPLMEVYSPELITAQQEFLIAAKGIEAVKDGGAEVQSSMRQLMTGALQRLRNWDISEPELQRLQKDGAIRRTITLRSPVTGVVIEKPALRGMRFMPGEALYQISDLSVLWVVADIFEQDISLIQPGQAAKIVVNGFPGRTFTGKVAFLYPTFTAETRTGKVRIELPNPGGLLKPAMYATVELGAPRSAGKALVIPESAVLDSGASQVVLVQRGEGLFDPRPVKLGMRAEGYVEVLEGVQEGEEVVVRANFLIDAESNLKAALGGFGGPAAGDGGAGASPSRPATTSGVQLHQGRGTVESMDAGKGEVRINHGPIASLKWPAMTMDFQVSGKASLKGLKPGQTVEFHLAQRAPGEFVIERIDPVPAQPVPAPAAPAGHKGH